MNTVFEFLSNIAETKLIIIGIFILFILIPLALFLKPVSSEIVKIMKHIVDKHFTNTKHKK
ncbi:BlyA family holin [Borrelia persica]|uniref:BlyA family holin n=1 Tax=Borrelia persica TaxID=44448 RepID=UPI0004630AA3|nr:BlyA family holin [Borrelia persica]